MRIEYNITKINMGHYITVSEEEIFKLQEAKGIFFQTGECVLWNIKQKCFLQDEQEGIFVFKDEKEAKSYIAILRKGEKQHEFFNLECDSADSYSDCEFC